MRRRDFVSAVLLCAIGITLKPAHAAPSTFQGLGALPGGHPFFSEATGVSADGTVVVGRSTSTKSAPSWTEAFRWTSAGGMVSLGDLPGSDFNSRSMAVSADGNVVVGLSNSSKGMWDNEAFRWTRASGMVGLGFLPSSNPRSSIAWSTSGHGAVIVGDNSRMGAVEAFRWTGTGGMVGLGDFPGGDCLSVAYGTSADGNVIVGVSSGGSNHRQEAFRWTRASGMVGLGDLNGCGLSSQANGVSADGRVVVGISNTPAHFEAFRWARKSGMVGLGVLPSQGIIESNANAASADGSVIVGHSFVRGDGSNILDNRAFLWNGSLGIVNLQDHLVATGATGLKGWTLIDATGVSADGRTITGWGLNPNGFGEAWLATVPELLMNSANSAENQRPPQRVAPSSQFQSRRNRWGARRSTVGPGPKGDDRKLSRRNPDAVFQYFYDRSKN
jgi:probable HAF family extracellular repeat protein